MSSFTDCLDRSPDWGSPVRPVTPEGGYKLAWAACDFKGIPRRYISWLMDCGGLKARGDHLDPREYDLMFVEMAKPGIWIAGSGGYNQGANYTPDQTASAVVGHFTTNCPPLRGWFRAYDPDSDQHCMIAYRASAALCGGEAAWRFWDLRSAGGSVTWLFGTAPPHPYRCISKILWLEGGDNLGGLPMSALAITP